MRTCILILVTVIIASFSFADIVGSWEGEIEGRRGPRKITFNFTEIDGVAAGESVSMRGDTERRSELENLKIDGDKISFSQTFSRNDRDFTIEYAGTLANDTMNLTRTMGDFGSRDFSVMKVKPNIVGSWKGEVESPRGTREIIFNFVEQGGVVSGNTIFQMRETSRRAELDDVMIDADKVSFTQTFGRGDRVFKIEYAGILEGDSIKINRTMGDFGTSDFTLSRMSAEDAKEANVAVPDESPVGGNPEPRIPAAQGISLDADDVAAFPSPPAGFDRTNDSFPQGKITLVEYDSTSVGTRRKMNIYTPPGYSTDRKYPVFYLLHGIGGDENEWLMGRPQAILDNLIAEGNAIPMVVVMPNGRAQKNDRAEGNVFASAPAFAEFVHDLNKDIIPFVESNYSVIKDRTSRALAGLSMGGGQSLNFGLGGLETFAWVGGFSSAPNTNSPRSLVPDPQKTKEQLKLLLITCGSRDGLITRSQELHRYLKANDVDHIWHVIDGAGHDFNAWKESLYYFAQKIFR